jgi:hypothetical protein
MREYRLIDADCHVVEPPHIWERWLPKQFQDRAPRLVKDEEGGDAWEFVKGGPLMYIGLVATPGMRFEDIKWKGYTYDTVRRGCWEGKSRLEDMDFDGVDAEFIAPTSVSARLPQQAVEPGLGPPMAREFDALAVEAHAFTFQL